VVLTGLGGDQWLEGSEHYLCDSILHFHWLEVWRLLRLHRELDSTNNPLSLLWRSGLKPILPKVAVRLIQRLRGRSLYPYSIESGFARAVALAARLDHEPRCPRGMPYDQRTIYQYWTSPWMFHVLEMDERSDAWAGVEGRHPFYDRRVLEFLFAIPEEQRVRLDAAKFVLRNAMKGLLPDHVRERRGKARLGRIFAQSFRKMGGERLFESMALESRGWVNARRMQQLCHERLGLETDMWPLWTIFAADLWCRETFDSQAPLVLPANAAVAHTAQRTCQSTARNTARDLRYRAH
jgi:asparagine synthase (glutamine-hydrolysing)